MRGVSSAILGLPAGRVSAIRARSRQVHTLGDRRRGVARPGNLGQVGRRQRLGAHGILALFQHATTQGGRKRVRPQALGLGQTLRSGSVGEKALGV